MNGTLTVSQIAKLDKLEAVITRGLQTFVDVGMALSSIKEDKLYLRDFDTFEAYCQSRWGWSRQRSNQLISAAALVENLPPTLAAKVETEWDARALLPLDSKEQKQAIREASKEGVTISEAAKSFSEKPTAIDRNVTTAVVKGPEKQVNNNERKDKEGWPIPNGILEAWDRAESTASECLSLVVKLRSIVRAGEEAQDVIYGEIKFQENISSLSLLFDNFKQVAPHAVCTDCQGRGFSKCLLCKGRGFLSAFAFKMYGNSDVKKIRAKQVSK